MLKPFKIHQFGGSGTIDTNGGPIVHDVDDPAVLARTIRASGCCEILILGHQGADYDNEGGATAVDGGSPTIILPSSDGGTEKDIRDALTANKCNSCNLRLYTCGGGDPKKRDERRRKIADGIGCTTWGTKKLPTEILNPIKSDAWCLDPKKTQHDAMGMQ